MIARFASHGRSRNGLHWRTALVCLYALNRARQDGTPYVERILSVTSGITRYARLGGAAVPFHSSSFNWRPPRGNS